MEAKLYFASQRFGQNGRRATGIKWAEHTSSGRVEPRVALAFEALRLRSHSLLIE